ncbi:hypothetical protein HNP60_001945 [Sphingobium sp. B1D3A]|uniref:Uncharacterized protein n=1 Tax=Sphingobium lignivorans TaxID=2735886 RepID=A0ABR6NFW7_9SPHN|nr:hypothetical protein [Sphingobium lignivorans]
MSDRSGNEVVIPYGNPNAALHIRLAGDYRTFCGRECEDWTVADTKFVQAIDSAHTCKRCIKGCFK